MTVTTSDLRKGLTIMLDGELYKITDWQHNKQGRGSAQVRLQLKNLRSGSNIERTFQAGASSRTCASPAASYSSSMPMATYTTSWTPKLTTR